MRKAADELLLPFHRILKLLHILFHPGGHRVEIRAHSADFIALPQVGAGGKIPRRNRQRRTGKLAERARQIQGDQIDQRAADDEHDGEHNVVG